MMDSVPSVEENSNDGLFPVPTSGLYDESTNLFPALNEPTQSFVFDATLSNDSRSLPSKGVPVGTKFKKLKRSHTSPLKPKVSSYKTKVKRLKNIIKELVYENAALLDELTCYELEIARAKQERKSLLKRLFQFLPMTEAQALQSSQALKSLAPTFQGNIPPSILGPIPPHLVLPTPETAKRSKRPLKGISTKKSKANTGKDKVS